MLFRSVDIGGAVVQLLIALNLGLFVGQILCQLHGIHRIGSLGVDAINLAAQEGAHLNLLTVAGKRGCVKIGTIQSHVAQLITAGFITDFGKFISRAEYERIIAEYKAHPDTAYETLKEIYEPGLIGIARAIYGLREG